MCMGDRRPDGRFVSEFQAKRYKHHKDMASGASFLAFAFLFAGVFLLLVGMVWLSLSMMICALYPAFDVEKHIKAARDVKERYGQ